MLVKQTIEHLLGGVSQEPDLIRPQGRVKELINAIPSGARGLLKRPPFTKIADLTPGGSTGFVPNFLLVYERSGDTYYIVVDADTGTPVVIDEGGSTVPVSGSSDYLKGAQRVQALAVGDRIYFVNTNKVVQLDEDSAGADEPLEDTFLIWLKGATTGDYKFFTFDPLNNETVTVTSSTVSAFSLAVSLMEAIEIAQPSWTVTVLSLHSNSENAVIMVKASAGSFLYVVDTPEEDRAHVIPSSGFTGDISQLPPFGPSDFHVHIRGDHVTDADDFYLTPNQNGHWVETYDWWEDEPTDLDPDTMPHVLTYTGSGFTWGPVTWEGRKVGDTTTNPWPSFVGKPIRHIFFHQGRLGFLSGNQVILSRAGEPTAFFRDTVRVLGDNSPIDIECALPETDRFQGSFTWNEKLYLYSENGQFVLTPDDKATPLTPRTVGFAQVSGYRIGEVSPVVMGDRVIMVEALRSGKNRVLAWTHYRDRPASADDMTQLVPSYISEAPREIAVDPNSGFIAVRTLEIGTLFVNFHERDERGMLTYSAWGKWEPPFGYNFRSVRVHEGRLIALIQISASSWHLMDLDLRSAWDALDPKAEYEDYYYLGGPTTAPYEFKVSLGGIYLRNERGMPETGGRLAVSFLEVLHGPSTDLTVTVTPKHRQPIERYLDEAEPVAGRLRVPVRALGNEIEVDISNFSAGSCSILGVYWEGDYTDLSRRA